MARTGLPVSAAWLALCGLTGPRWALAACMAPRVPSPYSDSEPNPFGWPLLPNDWDWAKSPSWPEKYLLCGGTRQSPIDITLDGSDCGVDGSSRPDGQLRAAANYVTARGGPKVVVSDYMRTASVEGEFGTLTLKDSQGKDVEYQAVQVHLTTKSLHTVNGKEYDAEMFVLHRPKDEGDSLRSAVMVSVLFSRNDDRPSAVFEQMGFPNSEDMPVRGSWNVPKVDLRSATDDAFQGPSYFYNGSIPVPPCTEMIKWFVLTKVQSVSKFQLQNLKSVLECWAGGIKKRVPFPNPYKSKCRAIAKNSIQVGGSHEGSSCAEAEKNGTWALTSSCWAVGASREEQADCLKSPIDITTGLDTLPLAKTFDMLHYKDTTEVLMQPTDYVLSAIAVAPKSYDGHGEFGYVILNGRIFHARKISIKAISSHTFNGTRYAAELVIEHDLFGDDLTVELETDGGATRRLGHSLSGPDDHLHRVMVSVPLQLGKENVLLRKLGLGEPANKHAIQAGHSYVSKQGVNLAVDLLPSFSGSWYWYSGGSTLPGCPAWGVRWMVFETPMEVSIEQLNFLDLKVSGFDSSRLPTPPGLPQQAAGDGSARVWRNHLPKFGVDASETGCSANGHWNYENPLCWRNNFSLCGSGMRQSPINIETATISKVGSDNFLSKCSWKPVAELHVTNTGFDVEVSNEQMGYIALTGSDGFPAYYQVARVNLHMPSEHMIDGKQFAAELQVVHQRQIKSTQYDTDDLVVTSFMFDLGPDDSQILKQLYLPEEAIAEGSWRVVNRPVDLLRAFGPALDGHFYRYDGSLTTPNCAETVKWFVFETPLMMSTAQWAAFKASYPNPQNNRPIQMVNGRTIAKDSFEDSELVVYRYYLGRNVGRNRSELAAAWVMLPVCGSIALAAMVMFVTNVRQETPGSSTRTSAGLVATIGRRIRYNNL